MREHSLENSRVVLLGEGVEARRRVICRKIVSAVDAVDIGNAGAAIAIAAASDDLIGALRTIVVISL